MREGGLEPPQDYSHYPLKVACLPIPPPPQVKEILNHDILKQEKSNHFLHANFVHFIDQTVSKNNFSPFRPVLQILS